MRCRGQRIKNALPTVTTQSLHNTGKGHTLLTIVCLYYAILNCVVILLYQIIKILSTHLNKKLG